MFDGSPLYLVRMRIDNKPVVKTYKPESLKPIKTQENNKMNHESIQLANATKHMCEVLWENLQEEMTFSKAIKLIECEPKYGRAVWDVLYKTYKKIRPTSGRGLGSKVVMTMPVAPSDIVERVGQQAGSIMSVIRGAKDYLLQVSDEDAEVMKREGYDDSVIDEDDHDLDDNFQPKVIDAPEPEPEREPEKEEARVEGVLYDQIATTMKAVLERAFEEDGHDVEKGMLAKMIIMSVPVNYLRETIANNEILALMNATDLHDELKRRGFEGSMTRTVTQTLS